MSIEIVEDIDPSLGESYLLEREEHWIKSYRSAIRRYGFNLAPKPTKGTLGAKRTKKQTQAQSEWLKKYFSDPNNREKAKKAREKAIQNGFSGPKAYVLYDPLGSKREIVNLKAFCHEMGLNYGRLHAVAIGRAIEYEGWKTHPDRKDNVKREFCLQSPDGTVYRGVGLRAFCKEHGLKAGPIYHLLAGITKTSQGRRIPGKDVSHYRSRSVKDWVMIDPNGNEVVITNLNAWCKQQGTYFQFMLAGGTINGWKLKL